MRDLSHCPFHLARLLDIRNPPAGLPYHLLDMPNPPLGLPYLCPQHDACHFAHPSSAAHITKRHLLQTAQLASCPHRLCSAFQEKASALFPDAAESEDGDSSNSNSNSNSSNTLVISGNSRGFREAHLRALCPSIERLYTQVMHVAKKNNKRHNIFLRFADEASAER